MVRFFAFAYLTLMAFAANATIITKTVELDLNDLLLPSQSIFTNFSLDAPTNVAAGDTLVLDITFARGESLIVTDIGGDSPREVFDFTLGFANPGDVVNLETTFDFLGVSGDLLTPSVTEQTTAAPRIGTFTFSNLTNTSFGFTGLSLSIDSLIGNDDFIVNDISLLATIDLFGQGTTGPNAFTQGAAVPEPSVLFLFISAVLALLVQRRPRFQR